MGVLQWAFKAIGIVSLQAQQIAAFNLWVGKGSSPVAAGQCEGLPKGRLTNLLARCSLLQPDGSASTCAECRHAQHLLRRAAAAGILLPGG